MKKTAFSKKLLIFSSILILTTSFFGNNLYKNNYKKNKKTKKIRYPEKMPFYIYHDDSIIDSIHYYPTGKMGNVYAIKITGNYRKEPYSKKSCIKVVYDHKKSAHDDTAWAGLYWLNPALNWGICESGGYNLSKAKKVIFYAKGEKGNENIDFFIGGITGKYGDSCKSKTINITLTKNWKKYEILLNELIPIDEQSLQINTLHKMKFLKKNNYLNYIIGGFAFTIDKYRCPYGATFYLDDIYYTDN